MTKHLFQGFLDQREVLKARRVEGLITEDRIPQLNFEYGQLVVFTRLTDSDFFLDLVEELENDSRRDI